MPRSRDPIADFHPVVRRWFGETLGAPSAPQAQGWPVIARGDHALILAPTGTGKTLAAFLYELDQLIQRGLDGPLPNAVQILYVSPLKALNNDIHRNLETPLAQLKERFEAARTPMPEIRVAVRTGDTPAAARARMIRKSPHILITTPESLHIMLTTVRGRGMFSGVRAVIVDEIHAVAGTKRGAHLALTLERLERMCEAPPQRIGLSATQRPLEEIARFLGGNRPVSIVDCGLVKQIETSVESPVEDLANPGGTIWTSVTPLVARRIRESRTTLVFVNNRGQAERMAARINHMAGEELALPYHGSLSRERRHLLEKRLKAGELRALISTSSLELGIDIGSVDLVIQLQSPKRVANALQRVGRAGHTLGAVSRGVFVPTFRDDGMEMLAIVRAMHEGDVEPTRVVQNALDVLAQVIVAAVSVDDDWTPDALFAFVRRAYPYHALSRRAFDEVLEMLSGRYPADVASELEARIEWDRVTGALTPARGARLTAVISGGTIPDRGLYTVVLGDRTRLGELDEEFVHETRVGDVFQLGSSTWKVQSIEHDRVIVFPAPGAPARMPFWHGEYAARSAHVSARIGELRRVLTADGAEAARDRYRCDEQTWDSLLSYVKEQRAAVGVVPDDRTLLLEQFWDETGSLRVVLHAPFGGRVNAPWGMALANRVREHLGAGFEIQVQTTDDGIMLRLPSLAKPLPVDLLRGLTPEDAERRVLQEVGSSSLFGARFRMNAARALLLPRGKPGKRMPLWLQRLKALDLLQAVREYPSFPILVETYRDVLQDAFDMPALAAVLGAAGRGEIGWESRETQAPSPFASSLQFGFVMDWLYADDAPRAEQRAAVLSLDRALLDELLGGGGVDDETLDVLDEIVGERRERLERIEAQPGYLGGATSDAARREVLARFASFAAPFTAQEAAERYGYDPNWVEHVLGEWTKRGRLVRGTFRGGQRWVSRRLLERARRRELARARKQIQAVELPAYARFLQRWQHLAPDARSDDAPGVVRQLYGMARPAEAWERDYLPARIREYDAAALTRAMTEGEMIWVGGASPSDETGASGIATLRWVKRRSARAWLGERIDAAVGESARSVRDALVAGGASFFADLTAATGMSARAVRDGLRELVAAGEATCDTMESLRAVLRWRPMVSARDREQPDPTRWLPEDFTPSANRYVVQRRPNLRRLPRWRRPELTDAAEEAWPGRWSLVRTPGVLGPEADESALAEGVARQMLARYGIGSREWWRRERPAVGWRATYIELRRLEMRGEVRRGYFVRGLAGAQFALPEAVELLRQIESGDEEPIVLAASDPANPYALAFATEDARDDFARPRGRGALLVTIAGVVVMTAEARGRRVRVRPGTAAAPVTRGAAALARYLAARPGRRRDIVVDSIDDEPAVTSRWADAFAAAGFRRTTSALRWYV